MKLLAERNYQYNQTIPLPTGLVNGQALGAVSGVKFGIGTVARRGCGVLAIYNALVLSGVTVPLAEVAYGMERFRTLWGLLGTNPYALGRALRQWNIQSVRLRGKNALREAFDAQRICLLAYWTGRPFLSTMHIVCACAEHGGKIIVYNVYSNRDVPMRFSADELTERRRIVTAYAVLSHENHREEALPHE